MAIAHATAQVPVAQADVARHFIPEWQLRQIFHEKLPGYTYVGIQETWGTNPDGDLVLFTPPSGTTLAIPLAEFERDIPWAITLVKTRAVFARLGRKRQ